MGAKVVVVTGASSGIGRGAARAFAARGDDVVLVARSAETLRKVAAELRDLPDRAVVAPADVTDEAAVMAVVRLAVAELGRIDAWVNAAGVWSYGRFEDTPSDVFRRVVDTNPFGAVHRARAALPVFTGSDDGWRRHDAGVAPSSVAVTAGLAAAGAAGAAATRRHRAAPPTWSRTPGR